MTENTNPARHSVRSRISRVRSRISHVRSRIRRVHVIAAAVVIAVLAAGGAAWAVVGGSGTPEATGPGGAQPGPSDSANPGSAQDAPAAASVPVPTWSAPLPRGRGGNSGPGEDRQPLPGMPTDLHAQRDGDMVVLEWTDNTNNEDGFTIFVAQGRIAFQINVPAGTTRYDRVTAVPDTRTCFAVVPFSWTNPVVSAPTNGWGCTSRQRS
jgi:hypothetical protein